MKSRFPVIFFDADDTLLDFTGSEGHSLRTILRDRGMEVDDSVLKSYRDINLGFWNKFSQGEISKEELKVGRYRSLIEKHQWDFDPEILSRAYLDVLKEQTFLVEGALELCRTLSSVSTVAIVTNGIEHVQKNRLQKSLLKPYIHFMVVSEECGYAKPHRGIFDFAMTKVAHKDCSQILMVGDRLDMDIAGGAAMGIKTCWFNPTGQTNQTPIRPDFEVQALSEIVALSLF